MSLFESDGTQWLQVGSCGTALDTTDGSTDVNPTTQLFIGSGLTLTNPSTGQAHLSGGGIQFNTDNEGGYLDVTGKSVDGSGMTINLIDGPPSGTGGFNIQAKNNLFLHGPSKISLTFGNLFLQDDATNSGSNAPIIWGSGNTSSGKNIFIYNKDSTALVEIASNGSLTVHLIATGSSFTVKDHSGNALLRVDENGTGYHIKTGQAWVADL